MRLDAATLWLGTRNLLEGSAAEIEKRLTTVRGGGEKGEEGSEAEFLKFQI